MAIAIDRTAMVEFNIDDPIPVIGRRREPMPTTDIRDIDYEVMHYVDALKEMRALVVNGSGEIEFTQLNHDDVPDHLENLSSLYYHFWRMPGKGEETSAGQYTKRITYRDVKAQEFFVISQRDKKSTERCLHLITDDVIKFTKCHLFEGKMRVRIVRNEEGG